MPKLLWRNKGTKEDDTRTVRDSVSPSPSAQDLTSSGSVTKPHLQNGGGGVQGRTIASGHPSPPWPGVLHSPRGPTLATTATGDVTSTITGHLLITSSVEQLPASISHRKTGRVDKFSSIAEFESNNFPPRSDLIQLNPSPPQHRHSLHFFGSPAGDPQHLTSIGILRRAVHTPSACFPLYTRRSSVSTPSLLTESYGANATNGDIGFESFKLPHNVNSNSGSNLVRRESFRSSPILGIVSHHFPNPRQNHIYGINELEKEERDISVEYALQGLSKFRGDLEQNGDIFGTEETTQDISMMAAQRDQLRGAGRHIRGMMGPVQGKEEDKGFPRKSFVGRSPAESMSGGELDHSLLIVGAGHGRPHRHDEAPTNDHLGLGVVKGIPLSNRRVDFSNESTNNHRSASNRGDILTQSLRRQTKRASKTGIADSAGPAGDGESAMSIHDESSDKLLVLKPGDDDFTLSAPSGRYKGNRKSVKSLPAKLPSSHEDVQVLNLQGFMESSTDSPSTSLTASSPSETDIKKKSRRRHSKKVEELRGENSQRVQGSRRKKHGRSRNRGQNDDDEVALRDLDELDAEMSGLVVGPRLTSSDPAGDPITLEVASNLRKILTGSPASPLPPEWMAQNFQCNLKPNLSYGLVQKKGGPCGVLACVQAHMMKSLMFGSYASPYTSPASPLRPSSAEFCWALAVALTEIIWRAGSGLRAVVALPNMFPHFTELGVGRYSMDGVTETLTFHTYNSEAELLQSLEKHLTVFTRPDAPACVLLLYSVMLTRGLQTLEEDMDTAGVHLINAHGYASQEVVNLLLTGQASTNTFDGDTTLGDVLAPRRSNFGIDDVPNPASSRITLRGVHQRADIGLLSLFEHYGSCKVGHHLKTPLYPVWVVCSESHYTCLFSRNPAVTSEEPPDSTFDLYYYDGLALQEDEIRLTIKLGSDEDWSTANLVPPLEHCVRTKWSSAAVDWNSTDPLL